MRRAVAFDLAGRQAGKGGNVGRQRFLFSVSGLIFPGARSEGNFPAPRGRVWVSKTRSQYKCSRLGKWRSPYRAASPIVVTSGCRNLWAGVLGQYISVMDTDHVFSIKIHFRRKMIPRNRHSSAKQCAYN